MIKFYTKLIQRLAKRYIAKHQPIVVGVTGSAGKSSAVTAIGTVLKQLLPERKIYFPSKQLNGELGMPLTIFQIEYFGPTLRYVITTTWKVIKQYIGQTKPYDIIVLEYGVDHVGEMDVLVDIAQPDFGVITNIDTVHFGDPEITRQEKSKLVKAAKNWYIPLVEGEKLSKNPPLIPSFPRGMDVVKTFAIHDKKADIDLVSHEFLLDNPTQAGTAGDVLIGDDMIEIITNSVEEFYLMYSAIWYDIAQTLWATSLKQLAVYLNLPASRATLLAGKNNSIILDSSYNSSPVWVYHMLDIVQSMRAQLPDYGLICLMGEMRELYDLTESAHQELAHRLASSNIDYIWLVWESTQTYMYESLVEVCGDDRVLYSTDSRKLGQRVAQTIASDDKKYIILVKWSQNTIFLEEAIKELLQNSDDVDQLCRQSDRWMIKKKQWFQSIHNS
jgi:UDP-N-acetylmuramoyl-tripeptide--D-alanyl-D-alanine ligase